MWRNNGPVDIISNQNKTSIIMIVCHSRDHSLSLRTKYVPITVPLNIIKWNSWDDNLEYHWYNTSKTSWPEWSCKNLNVNDVMTKFRKWIMINLLAAISSDSDHGLRRQSGHSLGNKSTKITWLTMIRVDLAKFEFGH